MPLNAMEIPGIGSGQTESLLLVHREESHNQRYHDRAIYPPARSSATTLGG